MLGDLNTKAVFQRYVIDKSWYVRGQHAGA